MDLWLGVVWWDYCDASIPLATDRVLNTLGGVLQSIVTVTSDACRHTWRQIHDVNEFHEMCVICSSSSGMPTAVEILGQAMVTDLPSSFSSSVKALSGFDMAKRAAEQAMASARVTVQDVDVVELHDCFAANELFMYEALGLAPSGGGGPLIDSAKWERNQSGGEVCRLGSRWVVNPSGGLESKGHPIGATGLAQCAELCWQLRGQAGKRQVERARVGLQHNFGIGGAAVVTVYRRLAPTSKL